LTILLDAISAITKAPGTLINGLLKAAGNLTVKSANNINQSGCKKLVSMGINSETLL
jgi:hypothetical protein